MPTRVYFVRHGATPLTAENRFSGDVGVDLSDEGRTQVKQLAQRLAKDPLAAVYCSPLSRTLETAALLAAPHRLTPIHADGLREISHGRWEGLTRQEVEERFGGEYASWEADPLTDEMTSAFPGAVELVARLRAQGHPVGIVTAKLVEPARRTLALTGLARHIDAVVGADTVPEHKPDPAPVLRLLSDLARGPAEAILVGDSPHDVAAGNAAGVATAAALWGASPHEALLAAHPRWLVTSLAQVEELVAHFEVG